MLFLVERCILARINVQEKQVRKERVRANEAQLRDLRQLILATNPSARIDPKVSHLIYKYLK